MRGSEASYVGMAFNTDIHVAQRINSNYFGDLLSFPLAPPLVNVFTFLYRHHVVEIYLYLKDQVFHMLYIYLLYFMCLVIFYMSCV